MAAVYECKMTKTITVNIKADNEEAAQDWIQTHNMEDVQEKTGMYDVDYDDIVTSEVREEAAIDISSEK